MLLHKYFTTPQWETIELLKGCWKKMAAPFLSTQIKGIPIVTLYSYLSILVP